MTQRFYISLLVAITLGLSACEPTQTVPITRPDTVQPPIATEQFDATILEAKQAIDQSNPDESLRVLSSLQLRNLSDEQQKQMLEAKIQAYGLTKNWLEKANNHILLAELLAQEEKQANQQALWASLMKLTSQSLELFKPGLAPAIDSGWFELAYIVKTYQAHPETLVVALEDWQRNYPNHPAEAALYERSLNEGTRLPADINHIAVFLPEQGPYKSAAEAIKQGLLSAHFVNKSSAELKFYPVKTDPSNIAHLYQQAIDNNASVIIGPLDKHSVDLLAQRAELPIPVISLNRLSTPSAKRNLFQFGLAPEDEAIAIANYAKSQGFKRAVVLASDDDWGRRVSKAFSQQWQDNNGVLLSQASYPKGTHDFSDTIKPFLGLSFSQQRRDSLRQTLGKSFEFEPRRRHDIDFIFLAAKSAKARQLVPQLRFHRSGSVPIIATSQAYSGQANSQQDIDLNNVILMDIPWMFTENSANDPVYNALKESNPKYFGRYVRLYALGADAYSLIPQLNRLSHSEEESYAGATGQLSIDEIGDIRRKPSKGVFKKGLLERLIQQ
ncbi:MAG: LppC family lipoprotein [Gammaproteobacteria bacterium]|nr:MAG: LppC family lipoprotein [Gammaproteobacteria bacterium]